MKTPILILNREFQHPTDGWYQIEAKGEHPNVAAGVVQVIDDAAAGSIVERFNADATSGALRHGGEMLIDHEHFSDNPEKESRAYGWLQELQNRVDGIYGKIRWTKTGREAVDGGDYRFFSTEYEPGDLEETRMTNDECRRKSEARSSKEGARSEEDIVNRGSNLREVRPLRLAGLTLTNMNNNRGQRPITNRGSEVGGQRSEEEIGRGAGARAADGTNKTCNRKTMSTLASTLVAKLGLPPEADEDAILAEAEKLIKAAGESESGAESSPVKNRIAELESANAALLEEQIAADFAAAGIRDEKVINRHKGLLADAKHFNSRAERTAFIAELAGSGGRVRVEQRKLHNRETRAPGGGGGSFAGGNEQAAAERIRNRATEIQSATRQCWDVCWGQAARELVKN